MIIQKKIVVFFHKYYNLEKIINKTSAILTVIASLRIIAKDGIHQRECSKKVFNTVFIMPLMIQVFVSVVLRV